MESYVMSQFKCSDLFLCESEWTFTFTPRSMVHSSHVGYIVFTSWTHMNATTKSLLRLEIFFKPRVSELWALSVKNVSNAMDAAKD